MIAHALLGFRIYVFVDADRRDVFIAENPDAHRLPPAEAGKLIAKHGMDQSPLLTAPEHQERGLLYVWS